MAVVPGKEHVSVVDTVTAAYPNTRVGLATKGEIFSFLVLATHVWGRVDTAFCGKQRKRSIIIIFYLMHI